ncbi:MAG: helix-turn-helix transcriptional regulator [Candidatus Dormibacteraeota bacterium]|uniref:Transcriptional regulator n=1 Tax=Candidatus Aeolococcus gillhamiae TaxID=3127015 RepID=A0A2W5ZA84_9BACT|nr:helix-turn-helix transcriptional regulator [Candidatus Dormibacteraeota bacterium]PZR82203.1 MAG: transcriptional regulator [Candidatus Dormibacter sp. RRmetagenome_bin12]
MTTVSELPMATTRVKGCCQELSEPLPAAVVDEAAALLRALSDPTRLQMLAMLAQADEPICVCDFTAAFDVGQPTVSHHLGKLRDAGLVTSAKHGIWAFYALSPKLPVIAQAVLAGLL